MANTRLNKVARDLNVGIQTLTEYLEKNGYQGELSPNAKIDAEWKSKLEQQFSKDKEKKEEIKELKKDSLIKEEMKKEAQKEKERKEQLQKEKEKLQKEREEMKAKAAEELKKPKVVGKIEIDKPKKEEPKKVQPKKEETIKPEAKQQKPVSTGKEKPAAPVKNETVKKPEESKVEEPKKEESTTPSNFIKTKFANLSGPKVMGKIEIKEEKKTSPADKKKRKRTRVTAKPVKAGDVKNNDNNNNRGNNNRPNNNNRSNNNRPNNNNRPGGQGQGQGGQRRFNNNNNRKPFNKKPVEKKEINPDEVNKQIKDTLARLQNKKSKGVKHRRDKREEFQAQQEKQRKIREEEKKTIQITEFVSVSELSNMIDVSANEIITVCMNLGLFVSINQRLEANNIELIADEFGYKVEFVSAEVQEAIDDEVEEKEEDLSARPPIVTVMGHVDHGKTSLLDYVRKTNVIGGEAGGITQHIGAYSVELEDKRRITFLDTPGHEAFTAMRARGAQVTDIAIIIVAADDSIMPQTKEAINHASAAGVPIVFAINKCDLPGANPDKVKAELAEMNYMVEEWGGKYQSHDISAKQGTGVDELLEKVLLEADLLDLKANSDRRAAGTVIESSLDKGRGYVTTLIVEKGTLEVGDSILAGALTGTVKAMFNERNQRVEKAGPATPVTILGLNGATQAGDKFNIMETEKEAKSIASKRAQLHREQGLRTQKRLSLAEIGRRLAIGNFQELNIIVKGDVDGSIEALSDSLIKQSTDEIQVNIIHKAIGAITESDIMLASASDAIIIGFQVRPTAIARQLADKEEIDIRLYSVIYDSINDVRDAMEGMLSPELREEIIGNVEIRETFKISKVGTIAGCYVREGIIRNDSSIRIIRDGIVKYEGALGSLKRFKDDVKEVKVNYECGLNIDKYNDIKEGDIIEVYEMKEYKKKL